MDFDRLIYTIGTPQVLRTRFPPSVVVVAKAGGLTKTRGPLIVLLLWLVDPVLTTRRGGPLGFAGEWKKSEQVPIMGTPRVWRWVVVVLVWFPDPVVSSIQKEGGLTKKPIDFFLVICCCCCCCECSGTVVTETVASSSKGGVVLAKCAQGALRTRCSFRLVVWEETFGGETKRRGADPTEAARRWPVGFLDLLFFRANIFCDGWMDGWMDCLRKMSFDFFFLCCFVRLLCCLFLLCLRA